MNRQIRGFVAMVLTCAALVTVAVAGERSATRIGAIQAGSARAAGALCYSAVRFTEAHSEGRFYIMVDGVLYDVAYQWVYTGGQWFLVLAVIEVDPSGVSGPTDVDSKVWPMGPGGPMPCDGCDSARVRRLIDPNGNGRPYWKDPGDQIRPSINIE